MSRKKRKLYIKQVTPGRVYGFFGGCAVLCTLLYIGFFAATMSFAAEREELRVKIAELSTEISEQELQLLAETRSLSIEKAYEVGFVVPDQRRFVSAPVYTFNTQANNAAY